MAEESGPTDPANSSVHQSEILSRILVAAGGSEPSISAFRLALHLAHGKNSDVEALIVEDVNLPAGAPLTHGDALAQLMHQAEHVASRVAQDTENLIKKIGLEHGVVVNARRERGRVADVIVEAGSKASLIVLGRRGCRPEINDRLGSNAELVVHRSKTPILIAPPSFHVPNRVLVAYGGKDMGAQALAMGLEIADALDIPLSVLSAADDERNSEEIHATARRLFPQLETKASFLCNRNSPATSILQNATRETVTIMGAYGHSRLYRLVLGSTTEQVLHACTGPLLLSRK